MNLSPFAALAAGGGIAYLMFRRGASPTRIGLTSTAAATAAWLVCNPVLVTETVKANIKGPAGRYLPNTPATVELLKSALASAKLAWSPSDPDLHYILSKESGGWVGKPNYTFGSINKAKWPEIWAELRNGVVRTKSTATGLGQLLLPNVKAFYPDGPKGIGDPHNEAVGFVKYIAKRYGSPAAARSVYNQKGTYVHGITGATRSKTFKEGY